MNKTVNVSRNAIFGVTKVMVTDTDGNRAVGFSQCCFPQVAYKLAYGNARRKLARRLLKK